MLSTPDPRHWWQLAFVTPGDGQLIGVYITETDLLDIAIARSRLNGQNPGGDVAATPFRATYVHADYLDLLMDARQLASMPVPHGFSKVE